MTAPVEHAPQPRTLVRHMRARDPQEPHRASTPLELLFDLCFVVAVAQAAAHLHHGLAGGHAAHALLAYAMVFFAIWWAWMNFTWFASAYDVDDVPYRLKVLLQIFGVLLLAAGLPRAFEQGDFGLMTIGYAIMRVALVAHWLRAARADLPRRRTARRFAIGVTVCEFGWLGLLLLPADIRLYGWLLLVPAELFVPAWAERAAPTPWHPHHIAERYGLLTLIVLGESVLAATVAIQSALDADQLSPELSALIAGAVLLLFAMWWLYFDEPAHLFLTSNRPGFVWGYGHVFVFSATAAVGAGIAACTDFATGEASLPHWPRGAAVTVPAAVYVASTWAFQLRLLHCDRRTGVACIGAAVLILCGSASRFAVLWSGVLLCLLVAFMASRRPARPLVHG